ncbi:Fc.00g026480.m01.CDS01 [Cosmosporella sp. VM-42]
MAAFPKTPDPPQLTTTSAVGSFARFPDLPVELRLQILELLLPPYQDLGIVDIDTFKHFDANPGDSVPHPPTKILLQVCSESRQFALDHGSFVSPHLKGKKKAPGIWIDRDIRAHLILQETAIFGRLRSLPSNIHTIACIGTSWPNARGILPALKALRKCLLFRMRYLPFSPVKIVYVGLSAIIYDDEVKDNETGGSEEPSLGSDSRKSCPLYVNSDVSIIGLDDARLPVILASAFEVAKHKNNNPIEE